MEIEALDHLELAILVGHEDYARVFYVAVLSLTEQPKLMHPTWEILSALSSSKLSTTVIFPICVAHAHVFAFGTNLALKQSDRIKTY